MIDRITLPYIASEAIQKFVAEHPIDWTNYRAGHLGQDGDVRTPTPCMAEFWRLLLGTGRMFCQWEYARYAIGQWPDFVRQLTERQLEGLTARLCCNFYVSGISTLHVWAMLVETGVFQTCIVDSVLDAVKSIDILVTTRCGQSIPIALRSGSPWAVEAFERKCSSEGRAGKPPDGACMLILPRERPRNPGNMRWYTIDDLRPVLERTGENATLAIARWKKAHEYSAIQGEFW
jgi:hypothetical protein